MGNKVAKIISYDEATALLGPELTARYKQSFQRVCGTPRGLRPMDLNTFVRVVLDEHDATLTPTMARRVFVAIDTSGEMRISHEDFLCGVAIIIHGTPEQQIKFLFRVYDVERKNKIRFPFLVDCCTQLAQEHRPIADIEQEVMRIWKLAAQQLRVTQTQRGDVLYFEEWRAYCMHPVVRQNPDRAPLLAWLPVLSARLQPSRRIRALYLRLKNAEESIREPTNEQRMSSKHFTAPETQQIYSWLKHLRSNSHTGILDYGVIQNALGTYVYKTLLHRICSYCDPAAHGIIEEPRLLHFFAICCSGTTTEQTRLTYDLFVSERSSMATSYTWSAHDSHEALTALYFMQAATSNSWVDPACGSADQAALQALERRLSSQHTRTELLISMYENMGMFSSVSEEINHETRNNTLGSLLSTARDMASSFGAHRPGNQIQELQVGVNYEQFEKLVQRHPELINYCFVIALVIRVSAGVRPSNPEEQRAIIESCHRPFQRSNPGPPGTQWYVISKRWWSLWKDYVGWIEGGQDVSPGNRQSVYARNLTQTDDKVIGPIDNYDLLVPHVVPLLKPNIHLGVDYVLVNSRVWLALHAWHSGGPALPRTVVSRQPSSPSNTSAQNDTETELELHPVMVSLKIYESARNKLSDISYTFNLSKYVTLRGMYDVMGKRTLLVQPLNFRLWYSSRATVINQTSGVESIAAENVQFPDLKAEWLPLPSLDHVTLEQAQLVSGSFLMAEIRARDGSWPLHGWSESTLPTFGSTASSVQLSEDQLKLQLLGDETTAYLGIGSDTDIDDDVTRGISIEAYRTKRARSVVAFLQAIDAAASKPELQQILAVATAAADRQNSSQRSRSIYGLFSWENYQERPQPISEAPHLCPSSLGEFSSSNATSNASSSTSGEANKRRPRSRSRALSEKLLLKLRHAPGHVGLQNLGNTCYMNASLQCLLNTRLLVEYFLCGYFASDVNTDAKMGHGGTMAVAFADLCAEVWTSRSKSLAPSRFKNVLASLNRMYKGTDQHDAHELLEFVLSGLAEDLNRNKTKPYIQQPDSNGRDDATVAAEWWLTHLKRELSIVSTLFTGQYKSTLCCESCGHRSCRFEPFTVLQVPLPVPQYRYVRTTLVFRGHSRPPLLLSVKLPMSSTAWDLKMAIEAMQPGLYVGNLSTKDQNQAKYEVTTPVQHSSSYLKTLNRASNDQVQAVTAADTTMTNPKHAVSAKESISLSWHDIPSDCKRIRISARELHVVHLRAWHGCPSALADQVMTSESFLPRDIDSFVVFQLPDYPTLSSEVDLRYVLSGCAASDVHGTNLTNSIHDCLQQVVGSSNRDCSTEDLFKLWDRTISRAKMFSPWACDALTIPTRPDICDTVQKETQTCGDILKYFSQRLIDQPQLQSPSAFRSISGASLAVAPSSGATTGSVLGDLAHTLFSNVVPKPCKRVVRVAVGARVCVRVPTRGQDTSDAALAEGVVKEVLKNGTLFVVDCGSIIGLVKVGPAQLKIKLSGPILINAVQRRWEPCRHGFLEPLQPRHTDNFLLRCLPDDTSVHDLYSLVWENVKPLVKTSRSPQLEAARVASAYAKRCMSRSPEPHISEVQCASHPSPSMVENHVIKQSQMHTIAGLPKTPKLTPASQLEQPPSIPSTDELLLGHAASQSKPKEMTTYNMRVNDECVGKGARLNSSLVEPKSCVPDNSLDNVAFAADLMEEWDPDEVAGIDSMTEQEVMDTWGFVIKVVNSNSPTEIAYPGRDSAVDAALNFERAAESTRRENMNALSGENTQFTKYKSFFEGSNPATQTSSLGSWASTSNGVFLRPYRSRMLSDKRRVYKRPQTENPQARGALAYESLASAMKRTLTQTNRRAELDILPNERKHVQTETTEEYMDLRSTNILVIGGGCNFSFGTTIIIEWDPALLFLKEDRSVTRILHHHPSVRQHDSEAKKAYSLSQCLDSFSQWERLDDASFCSKCSRRQAVDHRTGRVKDDIRLHYHAKKIEIWRAPPVLVLQLKRFHHHTTHLLQQKLSNLITFPLRKFNLQMFMARPHDAAQKCDVSMWQWLGGKLEPESGCADAMHECNSPSNDYMAAATHENKSTIGTTTCNDNEASRQDTDYRTPLESETKYKGAPLSLKRKGAVYDLYAVVNHHGAMGAGHYIACVRSPISGNWLEYNDDVVLRRNEDEIVTSAAYLLFYARRDVHAASLSEIFPSRSKLSEESEMIADIAKIRRSLQQPRSNCSIM